MTGPPGPLGDGGGPAPDFPLRSPRLLLRPFRESDFTEVHEYASDPEVTRYLRWGPNDASETLRFLRRSIRRARAPDAAGLDLAVVRRENGRVVGSLSLERRRPGLVEIGYCLARPVWGFGYATEAVRSAVRCAEARFAAAELFGLVAPGNAASERVLLRCGFELASDSSPYAAWMDGRCSTARAFRRPPRSVPGG